MSTPRTGREIRLASRPTGWPVPENFSLVEAEVPVPGDGQVLIRNQFISVDPYMRGRMNDVKSYVPPFQVGEPLEGGAVGEVVESKAGGFGGGGLGRHMGGWRDEAVASARAGREVRGGGAGARGGFGALGVR